MDDGERLEALEDALERLAFLAKSDAILVEGRKDEAALQAVGIDGRFVHVQSSGGPVKAAEAVWRSGSGAVIMTDWDRRGGSLARMLRENLESLGVGYDDSIRRDIASCIRPYSKDVESLDTVLSLLRARSAGGNDL